MREQVVEYLSTHVGLFILLAILIFSFILLLFYYIFTKDPPPKTSIMFAFILGVISVFPTLIIASFLVWVNLQIISETNIVFVYIVLIAPITEELMKASFIILLDKHIGFRGPADGLIYGAAVGSGFSAVENLIYGLAIFNSTDVITSLAITSIRMLLQIVGHPMISAIFGAGVGGYNYGLTSYKYQNIWKSFLLHISWNVASIVDFIPGFLRAMALASIVYFGGKNLIIEYQNARLISKLKSRIDVMENRYEASIYEKIIVSFFLILLIGEILFVYTQNIVVILLIYSLIFWIYAVQNYEHNPKSHLFTDEY
ncbi:MAG: PrsW family intramembrane metalloprotease [Candidatus Kariarchaeaceae archaeon]